MTVKQTDELRELIREAHGVNKDLQASIKEARTLGKILVDDIQRYLCEYTTGELKAMAKTIERQTERHVKSLASRFTRITDILLGKRTYKGDGELRGVLPPLDLEEFAEYLASLPDEQRERDIRWMQERGRQYTVGAIEYKDDEDEARSKVDAARSALNAKLKKR